MDEKQERKLAERTKDKQLAETMMRQTHDELDTEERKHLD